MLNTTNMGRAPSYQFRVEMERKRSINARENQRQIVAYVTAPNEEDAKREAKRLNKEFFPISARKV